MLLVAPLRKRQTFVSGSIHLGDLRHVRHTQRLELPNLPGPRIFIRNPSADELLLFSSRRVIKNRNTL